MCIEAFLGIKTEYTLEELSKILSKELCGGIEFAKDEDGVRDEVPAFTTQQNFLGLGLVLYGGNGYDGEQGGEFGLSIEQWSELDNDENTVDFDISEYVHLLLSKIEGIHPFLESR